MFRDTQLHPTSCIHVAATAGMDYWQHNHLVKNKNNILTVIKWHPPPVGWIKLNFDGSVINSQATIGFVTNNSEGHVLLVGANNIGENSINVAESVALQDGLATSIDKGWHQIFVEGESKLVIDSVLRTVRPLGASNILFKMSGI